MIVPPFLISVIAIVILTIQFQADAVHDNINSALNSYGAVVFESLLEDYSQRVNAILGNEKSQHLSSPEHAPHSYQDKYILAEQLTSSMGSVAWSSLVEIGISFSILERLVNASHKSAVSLRLEANHRCVFIKEYDRLEESPHQMLQESTGILGSTFTKTKVVSKITEYFYDYTIKYRIMAIIGVGASDQDKIVLQSRSVTQEVVTRSNQAPFPEVETFQEDLELGPFLSLLQWEKDNSSSSSFHVNFSINRTHTHCFTPVRNSDLEAVLLFFHKMHQWARQLDQYFTDKIGAVMRMNAGDSHQVLSDMAEISKAAQGVYIPLMPLFHQLPEENSAAPHPSKSVETPSQNDSMRDVTRNATSPPSPRPQPSRACLSSEDLALLLQEQQRSLAQQLQGLDEMFSSPSDPLHSRHVFSAAEARLSAVCKHLKSSIESYMRLVKFIEELIRSQLVRALGREITPIDFQMYMSFHYSKLYQKQYRPIPFSYAVRRSPLHTPEGTLRIEIQTDAARVFVGNEVVGRSNGGFQPIDTLCRSRSRSSSMSAKSEMSMAIDASTRIRFRGDMHVHGWLAESFADSASSVPALRMVATARQFSSYIVLLGSLSSATTFEPKFACLLQNKDELTIPLLLESIPNAKQFRDSIESLSPEQQRFAKAYRTMQLESTMFAVVALQVKPQLEQVLQLKPDSLTKEIALTQDIMKLFIDYQIPPDLLSYDEASSSDAAAASAGARIIAVKESVKKIMTILNEAKQDEVKEKNREREFKSGPAVHATAVFPQRMEDPVESLNIHATRGKREMPAFRSAQMSATAQQVSSAQMSSLSSTSTAPEASSSANLVNDGNGHRTKVNTHLSGNAVEEEGDDITKLPSLLDEAFDRTDLDHAVRPVIIKPGDRWQRARQRALTLSQAEPAVENLSTEDLNKERQAVFDLLDAVTRSGALVIENASLHVVVGATRNFVDSLMNTAVQRNMNPIESMERSSLIMARTLFNSSSLEELVEAVHVSRLR
jgi:hypothetical protein